MSVVTSTVRRYTSALDSGLSSEVHILELSTEVDGVTYRHLAMLPPLEHVLKVPSSQEDAIRGAREALQAQVAAGQSRD